MHPNAPQIANASLSPIREGSTKRMIAPAPVSTPANFEKLPTARADVFEVSENSVENVLTVLTNDFGADTAELRVVSVSTPGNGRAEIFESVVRYTPDLDFVGQDYFSYTVTDIKNGTAAAGVTVIVTKVPTLQDEIAASANAQLSQQVYYRQTASVTRSTRLRGPQLTGAYDRPILRFLGSLEQKGGFVVKGADFHLENVELWDASSEASGNGAGIRFEASASGTPSNLTCVNVKFRYCENGLLGPDLKVGGGTVTLTNCEFDRCGTGTGQEHGVYFNRAALIEVSNSYFHDTNIGHEFKSRADKHRISSSTFGSVTSKCSYEIEFPEGGDVEITDCTFIQSKATDNGFVVGYGAEWKVGESKTVNRLIIRNCVFWNFLDSGYLLRANFAIPNLVIEFVGCTFVGFTNAYQPEFAIGKWIEKGAGNQALTFADAYARFPNGPRELTEAAIPEIKKSEVISKSFGSRSWRAIEASALSKSLPVPSGQTDYNLRSVIDAWGGCSHVGDDNFFYGTGHSDGAINARANFNTATLGWTWATPQSNEAILATVNPYEATLLKDGTKVPNSYSDGLPSATHGWTNSFALANGDFGNFYGAANVRVYRRAAKAWQYYPFPLSTAVRYSWIAQMDSVKNRILICPNYFQLLLLDADTFASRASITLPANPRHGCIVNRELWLFCGAHGDQLLRFDLDTESVNSTTLRYPLSHAGYRLNDNTAVVYIREIGVLRIDANGRGWVVDPTTLACEPFSTLGPLPRPTNGPAERTWYRGGLIYLVASGRENVYVLKT